jgi:hypothetical protein
MDLSKIREKIEAFYQYMAELCKHNEEFANDWKAIIKNSKWDEEKKNKIVHPRKAYAVYIKHYSCDEKPDFLIPILEWWAVANKYDPNEDEAKSLSEILSVMLSEAAEAFWESTMIDIPVNDKVLEKQSEV